MKTTTDYIRDHLLAKVRPTTSTHAPSLEQLQTTQMSAEFVSLMENRTVVGFFRYGGVRDGKHTQWDRMGRVERLVKEYKETKNKECLVDIANLSMLEFVEGDGVWNPKDDEDHADELQ